MPKQGNGNGNGKMTLTRRDFLKVSAAAGAGGGLLGMAGTLQSGSAVPPSGTPAAVFKSVPTTCPFCSVGCGQMVDVDVDGNVLEVRGDPNHVVNRGALCPKGASTVQFVNGDRRLGTSRCVVTEAASGAPAANPIDGPRYRDGNGAWTKYTGGDVSTQWTNAIADVATRLKHARDIHGTPPAPGNDHHSKAIAFLGCSHATNEENWVYRKLIANLGTNNTEHQARI